MLENLTIFDCLFDEYKITKPIRLIELFGGVGSQAMALRNIGANFEHYRLVEWDKFPVASYNAIHKTNFEPTDITKIHADDLGIIDTNKYEYIITYSFPCQDLSLAGKQKGMTKGSGTRSGLLWEVERLLNECKELPQILLMENVPEVIGQKNIEDFQNWQYFLESKGYQNYVQVLNAKDYSIPQNRRRCFMVSILGDYNYTFPKKQKLKLKLKDMLEDEVEDKYFLSDKMISFFKENSKKNEDIGNGFRFKPIKEEEAQIAKTITTRSGGRMDDNYIQTSGKIEEWHQRGIVYKPAGIAPSICATDYKTPKLVQVGELDIKGNDSIKRIYSSDGLSPTLTSMQGGNRQPKIVVTNTSNKALKETLEKNIVDEYQFIDSYNRAIRKDGISGTITTRISASNNSYVCVPQLVKVRKYPVDIDNLKKVLRNHKNMSISNIANNLNKPKTLVEHWFRKDDNFAIPDADVWFDLKELLCIKTDEFDKSITTFEERKGVYEKSNRVYHQNGISPTITRTDADIKVIVEDEINIIGNYSPSNHNATRIVHNEGIAPTVKENHGSVTATIDPLLRIRKLTPKECWRLMGFKDEDFDAASKVNSNAQLYKQAGNSIVVNVLEAIFKQLI